MGKLKKEPETKEVTINNEKNKFILTSEDQAIISNIVLKGDISGLSATNKVKYYNLFCRSLGLNPATQPFQIISFRGGKEVLYATKDCTEQLRKLNSVSITDSIQQVINDILIVKVKGIDKHNREDCSTGAVNIKNMSGNDLANAIMKAETKAKRRLTLSICGLGILDETEIETIPDTNINKKFDNDKIIDTSEITPRKKEVSRNNTKYYHDIITENILTWKELKEVMISSNIIPPGKYIVTKLIKILKMLSPEKDKLLKNEIEKLLNNISGK